MYKSRSYNVSRRALRVAGGPLLVLLAAGCSNPQRQVAPSAARPASLPEVGICRPEAWVHRISGLNEDDRLKTSVKNVGDLNSDGLAEFALEYPHRDSASGFGGLTLLSSTGGADCFRVVFEGGGGFARALTTRSGSWLDVVVTGSGISEKRGRVIGSWRASFVGSEYRKVQAIDCGSLAGDDFPAADCDARSSGALATPNAVAEGEIREVWS